MSLTTVDSGLISSGAITLTTQVTGTLPVANGGTGVTASKQLVQNLNFITGAVATGTTVIPLDDTIPQITEGDQYMTLAITPTSITSTLEITVSVIVSNSAGNFWTTALFRDAVANALAVATEYGSTATGSICNTFSYVFVPASLSAITFRVRIGSNLAGTTTFNGRSGTRDFGGTLASSITIKEYTA